MNAANEPIDVDRIARRIANEEKLFEERAQHAAEHLRSFDVTRLTAIRDQMLAHQNVTEDCKAGLRRDPLQVFYDGRTFSKGQPTTLARSKPSQPPSKRAKDQVGLKGWMVIVDSLLPIDQLKMAITTSLLVVFSLCICIIATGFAESFYPIDGLVGCAVGCAWIFHLWRLRCPKCKRLGAAKKISSELLDRSYSSERQFKTARHYDSKGTPIGQTDYETQKLVTSESHLCAYRCKYCGFEWEGVERTGS